jgi:hypothetical protein
MATLTTQVVTRAGIQPTYAACAGGGDSFVPTERTYLHIKNGSGGAITVTVVAVGNVLPNMAVPSVVVSVTAGQERKIGPFPYEYFADPTDGLADITYSGVTSLTIGVFRESTP